MVIDHGTYELNEVAKKRHACINPRCNNFVELQNSYGVCMRCFDMLVEYMGSEHYLFEYATSPALKKYTKSQLKILLRRAEDKFPSLKSVKRDGSNSQRRWVK